MLMGKTHVKITGEFATEYARACLYEKCDFDTALKMLMGPPIKNETETAKRLKIAMDVLNGHKKFVGTHPDEIFRLEDDNSNEVPGIGNFIKRLALEWDKATEQVETYLVHRDFLLEQLSTSMPHVLKDILDQYENTFDEPMLTAEESEELGITTLEK